MASFIDCLVNLLIRSIITPGLEFVLTVFVKGFLVAFVKILFKDLSVKI